MWTSKRRLREKNTDLRDQLDRMRTRAETAESNEKTERHNRELITRQFCEADATNVRLDGRVRRLTELLELAREAQNDGAFDDLQARLESALRDAAEDQAAVITAHRQLKEKDAELARIRAAGDPDARRKLQLAERARRDLHEQLTQLQAVHEAMCREAVDRAGNLSAPPVSVPKPSEVTR
ncbi:hypothetical protein [Streptomyces sp. NPDC005322]|uniref:hypothetical protein n=1 Tax=Streptomyces sp. NPDC005322 TaxID=3157032 RepID=UPI0033B2A59D